MIGVLDDVSAHTTLIGSREPSMDDKVGDTALNTCTIIPANSSSV